ncbi:MAG TPA: alpha/beta hydrolase [Streptosporangiaceae bacterium]|jgi:pimeloyl-ACP methyl ester carboxylesterase|nr:alpha/beta hydrolase [Streptosporangiaceae bacterium]
MASWRRITGAAGLVVGTAAAGAGAILAAERIAVGRLRSRPDPESAEPLGELRGLPLTVLTEDGVPLHVETNGPASAPVSVVFCHGYTLNQDCWHFQRRDLDGYRLVFWDQRDHGRSGRSAEGAASIDQLGSDLMAVLEATVPGDSQVVLVGHSMGGMTIMALAEQHPELFGSKVVGVVLISTTARGLESGSPWMPGPIRPVLSRALPGVLSSAAKGRRAILVEHGRRSADMAFLFTRLLGFGDGEVSPAVVGFLGKMIASTPIEVIARFSQALLLVDKRDALPVLSRVPVTVVVGEKDRLIASRLGIELAMDIPGAQLVWVPGAGHALILERPALVNEAIISMLARVGANGGLPRSA